MKNVILAIVVAVVVCLTGNAMAQQNSSDEGRYYTGFAPNGSATTASTTVTTTVIATTVVPTSVDSGDYIRDEEILNILGNLTDQTAEMGDVLMKMIRGKASEAEVNKVVNNLSKKKREVASVPNPRNSPKIDKAKGDLFAAINRQLASLAKKVGDTKDELNKRIEGAHDESTRMFGNVNRQIVEMRRVFMADQKRQDDEIAAIKVNEMEHARNVLELVDAQKSAVAKAEEADDKANEAKTTAEEAEAKAGEAATKADKADAKAEEALAKAEEAKKAAVGSIFLDLAAGVELFFTTNLRAIGASLDLVVCKNEFRLAIGGVVGLTAVEDTKLFATLRLRPAYAFQDDFIWLGVFVDSYFANPYFTSGQPYSDSFGYGAGGFVQFNFAVSETLSLGLDAYVGPAFGWDKRELGPPPGIQRGERYQTDEYGPGTWRVQGGGGLVLKY